MLIIKTFADSRTYMHERRRKLWKRAESFECIRLSSAFSWNRDRRSPGSVNTRRRRSGPKQDTAVRQVADRRPQVDRKEDIAGPWCLGGIAEGGRRGEEEDRQSGRRQESYGFAVVPCVRRNFPQRRAAVHPSVRRRVATPRTGVRTCTCRLRHCSAAHSFSFLPSRMRNRTFSRFLRRDITRSLLGRDGISKWHALRGV